MNRIINILVNRPKESRLINECITRQGVLFLPFCHPLRAIFKRLGGQITNITEDKGSPSARCELREMPERTEPEPRISRSRGRRERGASGHTPRGTRGLVTLTIMPLLSSDYYYIITSGHSVQSHLRGVLIRLDRGTYCKPSSGKKGKFVAAKFMLRRSADIC